MYFGRIYPTPSNCSQIYSLTPGLLPASCPVFNNPKSLCCSYAAACEAIYWGIVNLPVGEQGKQTLPTPDTNSCQEFLS